jgi:hypothetical protein
MMMISFEIHILVIIVELLGISRRYVHVYIGYDHRNP